MFCFISPRFDFCDSMSVSTLSIMCAVDSAIDWTFVQTEAKSILFICPITRVATSEKLSMSEGAGGMSGRRGIHVRRATGGGFGTMLSSMRESPVMPLDATVARSPCSMRVSIIWRISASSGRSRNPIRRRLRAISMRTRWMSAGEKSPVLGRTSMMSLTSPIFTPRKFTALPTESPLTGLS